MPTSVLRLEAWFREELPRLNRAVLHDNAPTTTVVDGLAAVVLPELPSPSAVSAREAQLLVIGLGLAGSSVARHFQEQDPERKKEPERSFEGLYAGPEALPFADYFAALADRTGTGHCPRDAYASLVIWNVPTTAVRFQGGTLATLPGMDTDQHIRSYTGNPGEGWFFELVKRGQTIELAVNELLAPLFDGEIGLVCEEGLRRVRLATTLLEALRRLFVQFAVPSPGLSMTPRYFMDVFRQFAVHWSVNDIPPSGALDVDAIKRDFLLGTVDEFYLQHVERIMPAMLTDERTALVRIMQGPSLPVRLLAALDIDPAQPPPKVGTHPAIGDWCGLLSAHSRAAGGHLMLSKRFLFNPQRQRDEVGIGDRPLVSNRRGTTGMDESILDRLTRMRREHLLAGFRERSHPSMRFDADDVEIVSGSGQFNDRPIGTEVPAPRIRIPRIRPERARFRKEVIEE